MRVRLKEDYYKYKAGDILEGDLHKQEPKLFISDIGLIVHESQFEVVDNNNNKKEETKV